MSTWFRVPPWCMSIHSEASGDRARAWVYLLGSWHNGDNPSVREIRRVTGFGGGRADALIHEVHEWAIAAGATVPPAVARRVAGQHRGTNGAATGHQAPSVTDTSSPSRGTNGAVAGQERGVSRARVLLSEREEREKNPPTPQGGRGLGEEQKPPTRAEPPIPGGAYANWRPPTITFAAPAPAPVAEPAPPPPSPTRREPPELLCDLLGDASMGRTARALAYAGITPAVLVRMTKRDLRYTSGIGGAWRVIADACERAGWPLSGPDPDDDAARPGARPPPSGPFDFDDYATWPETFDGARFETWPAEVKNGQIPIPREWWRQIPDSHRHLKTVRAHG